MKNKTEVTVVVNIGLDKLGAALSRFTDSAERLLDADLSTEAKVKKQAEDWFILEQSNDHKDRQI